MRFRAREKTLTHAWISGCLHGGLLLAMALGPALRGAVQWALQGATWSLSVPVVMQGAAARSGLGLSVMVVRALYALSCAKAPDGSALTSRAP